MVHIDSPHNRSMSQISRKIRHENIGKIQAQNLPSRKKRQKGMTNFREDSEREELGVLTNQNHALT